MNNEELYNFLSSNGIRIFALSLGKDHSLYIHPNKTVSEWRSDIERFKLEINSLKDNDGYADDEAFNSLTLKLLDAGYCDVNDMVADVYEGRISKYSAGIVDDPAHEEQANGFGHYGWESKGEI